MVRAVWDEELSKWWFSIVDIVGAITDSPNPRKYWSVLKTRLKKAGNELTTRCSQLKMTTADDKKNPDAGLCIGSSFLHTAGQTKGCGNRCECGEDDVHYHTPFTLLFWCHD